MLKPVPKEDRPATPRRARGENVRAAILDAARKLCFSQGPDGVSARKIAAEVGCSATAIYLYYESLEHVLHILRVEGQRMLAIYLRRPSEDMPSLERIRAMQREYFRFGREHPSYFSLMFLSRFREAPPPDAVREETFTLMIVRDAVALGIGRKEIRSDLDPLLMANVVWMEIHGFTSLIVSGHLPLTAPDMDEQLLGSIQDATAAWLRGSRRGRARS